MSLDSLVGSQDWVFSLKRLVLGRNRVRRVRLYCVGAGKTGTHSIARMFCGNVRSRHEPEATLLIQQILNWRTGKLSEAEMTVWLRRRDRRLALEVDSSNLNWEILDLLRKEFPDARYLLTLRDCYSWMNSMAKHWIRYQGRVNPAWDDLRKWRGGQFPHTQHDKPLQELGLPSLDTYLSRWTTHNQTVLDKIPSEQLMIVRTSEIRQRAGDIAAFAGLPSRLVRLENTHAFKNPAKENVIQLLDPAFIEEKVEQHCRPLMTRFFPEITSLKDVRL